MMEGQLSCKHLLGNLSDYVDGELAQEFCAEIERHLSECENCQVVVNTLRKTVEIVHLTSEEIMLPEAIHHRLFACLQIPEPKRADPSE